MTRKKNAERVQGYETIETERGSVVLLRTTRNSYGVVIDGIDPDDPRMPMRETAMNDLKGEQLEEAQLGRAVLLAAWEAKFPDDVMGNLRGAIVARHQELREQAAQAQNPPTAA